MVNIVADTDYTTLGADAHLRFHGLEPAVHGLHPALWTAEHTSSKPAVTSPAFTQRHVSVSNLPKVTARQR